MDRFLRRALVMSVCVGVGISFFLWTPASALTGSDWTKYVHDNASSGFTAETAITTSNASTLKLRAGWPMHSGPISVQPVVYNNQVFWGSWDGHMNAAPVSGGAFYNWSINLGSNQNSTCGSNGISSTPDIVNVAQGQTSAPYLIVGAGGNKGNGGGNAQVFALDPANGAIHWQTPLGPSPDNVIWSSPADYSYTVGTQAMQSVYIGLSSWCDEPLVQGKVVQLDAATGVVQNTFNVVPDGCVGGSVWGSPTVDATDGSLYFVTGNGGSCIYPEPYAFSIVKLRAADLSYVDSWQVPASEQVPDSDFGSTPTLFKGTVWTGGPMRNLIGVANKNGTYYIFDRANIHQGPMYRAKIATPSEDPFSGGSISPSAYDGTRLYVAGGPTKIGVLGYKGSLRALNPNNLGKPFWTLGLNDGPVLAAVTAALGIVVVGEGKYAVVVNSSSGSTLKKLPVNGYLGKNAAMFWGAPSISHGVLYEGDSHGVMYAYSVGGK